MWFFAATKPVNIGVQLGQKSHLKELGLAFGAYKKLKRKIKMMPKHCRSQNIGLDIE